MHIRGYAYLLKIFFFNSMVVRVVKPQLAKWSSIYESPIIKEPKPGWARFCKGDQVYDTFANQCPVGIFWDNKEVDTKWDCVCTRGPWRRSSGWCTDEDTQRFTQGGITCFQLDPAESSGLQAMYYVGDRFSAWDSSLPILLTDYRAGITVRKGDLSVEWEISGRSRKEPGILIYRPRDDWAIHDKLSGEKLRLCLRAPDEFNEETEGLFIYNISSLFDAKGGSQTFHMSITRGCYSWKEHDHIEWREVIAENLKDKNMVVQAYNPKSAPDECVQCMATPIPTPPQVDVDGSILDDREEYTIYDLKNVAVLKTEIDLQSERLGQYWAHRMLQNGSDPIVGNFQEMEILTRAAIMALDTCNSTIIPLEFYQYFLIMFKMLLAESFKKFPPKGPISKQYYSKINELLGMCKDRKLDISFQSGATCPSLYEGYSIKSAESDAEPEVISLNKDYTSDKGRHDFLLEFIWRLSSFLHYKCFQEFERNSVLLDVIQQQLESIFTDDLILRWYNPGASFQMYNLIFENHLDLESTMKNFQRCVTAMRDVSKYPGWLKRPIDRPEVTLKKGSKSQSSRLKRDIGSIHRNEQKAMRRRAAPLGSLKTGSGYSGNASLLSDEYYGEDEEVITGPYNLFDGTAACIKSIRSFMMDTEREAGSTCW